MFIEVSNFSFYVQNSILQCCLWLIVTFLWWNCLLLIFYNTGKVLNISTSLKGYRAGKGVNKQSYSCSVSPVQFWIMLLCIGWKKSKKQSQQSTVTTQLQILTLFLGMKLQQNHCWFDMIWKYLNFYYLHYPVELKSVIPVFTYIN